MLGTVGYMAPEQVRGEAADHRTDLFALGLVLHEMLSGQPAFHRGTPADSMTAVLRDDPPDLPAADRHIAPALVRIVTRCLQKSPSARFQTAADLAFALESLSAASDVSVASAAAAPAVPSALRRLSWLWPLVAIVAIGVGIWGMWTRGQSTLSAQAPIELTITEPPGTTWVTGVVSGTPLFSVSPDGRSIAFTATDIRDRKSRVWVRDLSDAEARPIPNTEGAAIRPFWSPDSQFVAFTIISTLFQVDRKGLRQRIAEMPVGRASRFVTGTWGRDGDILLAIQGRIYRIRPRAAATLFKEPRPAQDEVRYVSPHFLPDGRHFTFGVYYSDPSKDLIAVGSVDEDAWRELKAGPWNAWAAGGQLLFNQDSALLGQPFDAKAMRLTDQPHRLPRDVRLAEGERTAVFEVGGRALAYVSAGFRNDSQLTWFDRSGRELGVVGGVREVSGFDLSSDASAVVFSGRADQRRQSVSAVWLLDGLHRILEPYSFSPDQRPGMERAGLRRPQSGRHR